MKATVGRIWEAASAEQNRPVLTYVAFDAKQATLTATDSYIAARVPCVVEEGDESGLIPAVALKKANGQSLKIADGKATLKLPDGERSWSLLTDKTFPDVDKILAHTEEGSIRFGLNATLLRKLGAALGRNERVSFVALHPVHPLKPMLVTGEPNTVGILMPVRLPGHNGTAPAAAPGPAVPDLSNDEAVITAARAAIAALDRRRGKKKAAEMFRVMLTEASQAK